MSEASKAAAVPGRIRVNGVQEKLSCATIAGLLLERGHAPDMRGIAVARNGRVIPRSDWAATPLCADDSIEIVLAKQGG